MVGGGTVVKADEAFDKSLLTLYKLLSSPLQAIGHFTTLVNQLHGT
jgi:hypothetical protein